VKIELSHYVKRENTPWKLLQPVAFPDLIQIYSHLFLKYIDEPFKCKSF
jgi:hypothetical protein